jgi:hypothetical protein
MVGFLDVCKFTAASNGTGDFVVAAAVTGYQTPAGAGAVNGTVYSYRAESADLTQWEVGYGAYTVGSVTLARSTVLFNSSGTTARISFTVAPSVGVVLLAEDVVDQSNSPSFRNRLINQTFSVDQRFLGVATAIADNAYWADRWRALCETSGNTTCTARSGSISGSRFSGAVQFTGTTDKGGVFQVVEGINIKDLRSTQVTLSATIAISNARIGNIKMGILEWTGAEDNTTADPVSSWGADGVTPTLAAGWAFLNTPANLGVTITPTRFSVTATTGASMVNLAVMIWNDDKSYTANDGFFLTDVVLEPGDRATAIERRNIAYENTLCARYFRSIGGNTSARYGAARTTGTTSAELIFYLVIPMRGPPTVTVNNFANWNVNDAAVAAPITSVVGALTSLDTVNVNVNCGTVTANRPAFFTPSNTNATMWMNAEI